jgi:hypothetical protein
MTDESYFIKTPHYTIFDAILNSTNQKSKFSIGFLIKIKRQNRLETSNLIFSKFCGKNHKILLVCGFLGLNLKIYRKKEIQSIDDDYFCRIRAKNPTLWNRKSQKTT